MRQAGRNIQTGKPHPGQRPSSARTQRRCGPRAGAAGGQEQDWTNTQGPVSAQPVGHRRAAETVSVHTWCHPPTPLPPHTVTARSEGAGHVMHRSMEERTTCREQKEHRRPTPPVVLTQIPWGAPTRQEAHLEQVHNPTAGQRMVAQADADLLGVLCLSIICTVRLSIWMGRLGKTRTKHPLELRQL